jgi:thiol-disulfide isomerase/thioredoxin
MLLMALLVLGTSTVAAQKKPFSPEALQDTFLTMEGETVSLGEILEKHKGRPVFVDIWATWCKDCLVGMPQIRELMEKYPDIAFVFLSLDKDMEHWKKGIPKYGIEGGDHYFSEKGWKSALFSSIELDWVPRYMLLDKEGNITLYRAIKSMFKLV